MSLSISRRIRRLFLAIALLAAVGVLARAPLPVAGASAENAAPFGAKSPSVVMQAFRQGQEIGSGPNRAALVVRYGDGAVQTRCIAFSEDEIGGDELLDRSGLLPVFGPSMELCSINGEGCPSDDCFCQCPFPNCEYWAYYHWKDTGWLYATEGAAGYVVKNGALEGWSWGPGDFSQGTQPPVMSFDQICSSQAQATATPTATATSLAPPQVSFLAAAANVQPGGCTALSWQTTNAITVLLDGVSVGWQGSSQVCPAATQTYTLIAGNAAGQTTRQVTVQVGGTQAGSSQPTLTPTNAATGAAGGAAATPTVAAGPVTPVIGTQGGSAPVLLTPFAPAISTQVPGAFPQPDQAGAGFPTPETGLSPLAPGGVEMMGGVPLAPTAEPPPQPVAQGPLPTPTRFVFERPPTETPRPRRLLGEDGRPTPTPMIVARVGAGAGSSGVAAQKAGGAAGTREGPGALVQSRAFSPDLLPQYAAYLATLTVLLGMGWLVHRRRNGGQPSTALQPVREPERSGE